MALRDEYKKFEDVYNRLDTIQALDTRIEML